MDRRDYFRVLLVVVVERVCIVDFEIQCDWMRVTVLTEKDLDIAASKHTCKRILVSSCIAKAELAQCIYGFSHVSYR